jgi:hypothetical protein
MTGWLPLYLRSRRVPPAASASAAAVTAVASAWAALTGRAEVHPGLAALTVALAAAPLVPTLAADDADLERTAALRWPPRRALHLVACAAFVAGLLIAARLLGADFGPAGQIARNAAGMVGLLGLGAAAFGTGHAWQLPFTWAAVQCVLPVPGGPAWRQAALYLVQPPDSRTAAITAGALLLAGTAAYACRVGPPVAPAEATMGQ